MKRICFVTTISATIKAFLIELSEYLVGERGYDVTFICSPDESLKKYTNSHIHYIPVAIKRGVGLDGLKVIHQLTKIFKSGSFDIVQYSTPNAALYASIAAKRAGIKNRLYCQWGIRYMGFSGIGRYIMKIIEKITCSNSTIIECESLSLMKFSLSENLYTRDKSSVIWNGSACGVNLAKFQIENRNTWREEFREKLNIPKSSMVFGYAGRITRDKGINELFRAFKAILDKYDTRLLMVGEFDNAETIDPELRKWAKENPKIIFTGWTSEVAKYYCAMDVFLSLSYREGFGLVVIEAAAMGIPAIVTDVPGQIDTVSEFVTGIHVPAKDSEKVKIAAEYLIEHPDKATEMGISARRNVEGNYEQQKLFAKLADHRDNIIGK